MDSVGIRELRNQVASVVRRARSGERMIITVDGVPVAQLGPLMPAGSPTLEDLAGAGLVRLPGRVDHPPSPAAPAALPIDVRPDGVLAELRGNPVGWDRR